jgi:hypothetical protein
MDSLEDVQDPVAEPETDDKVSRNSLNDASNALVILSEESVEQKPEDCDETAHKDLIGSKHAEENTVLGDDDRCS